MISELRIKPLKNTFFLCCRARKASAYLRSSALKNHIFVTVLGLKDLAINGKDLMAAGIPAGKQLGTILNQLLETVLDDPSQNNREQLLTIATKLAEKYCN